MLHQDLPIDMFALQYLLPNPPNWQFSWLVWIQTKYGVDVWQTKIQPRMKDIVLYSLSSAKESIVKRKNSHELYGYDFMVDEDLNTWLLEINCSPSLEHSTSVTTNLVKLMMHDLVKVREDLTARVYPNEARICTKHTQLQCLHRLSLMFQSISKQPNWRRWINQERGITTLHPVGPNVDTLA